MESQLDRKVREYQRLLDRKAELEMQTKENNAAKEALEQEICRMMVDEEKPNTIVDGFSYSCLLYTSQGGYEKDNRK